MLNDRVRTEWTPVPMLDLRGFNEAIDSYGMLSPLVKQMLSLWSVCNRIITQDQIHGEGNWATIERQCLYESHILALCHVAVLNA